FIIFSSGNFRDINAIGINFERNGGIVGNEKNITASALQVKETNSGLIFFGQVKFKFSAVYHSCIDRHRLGVCIIKFRNNDLLTIGNIFYCSAYVITLLPVVSTGT